MTDQAPARPIRRNVWKTIGVRSSFLLVTALVFYILWPRLVHFATATQDLQSIDVYWFLLMAILMTGAFAAAWELTHIAVPGISRFVAATSQLASNAMVKVVPGGPIAAGAGYFQMLSVSGVPAGRAAAGLAAATFISNLVLFSLPALALLLAAVSAPIPKGLLPVGIVGTTLFVLMFTAVFLVVKYDRPLLLVGRNVERVATRIAPRFNREWTTTAEHFLDRRNEVVEALGARWFKVLGAAVLNWVLDYAVLMVALVAVGAEPRPSLVLVAFAGSAVLGMIPITPGGLGFVEVGLSTMLVAAGIPASSATLATLAYRMFQFWLPIPAGAVAYVLFRRQFGIPSEVKST